MRLFALAQLRGGAHDGAEVPVPIPHGRAPVEIWIHAIAGGCQVLPSRGCAECRPYHLAGDHYAAGPASSLSVVPTVSQPPAAAESAPMQPAAIPDSPSEVTLYVTPRAVRWLFLLACAMVLAFVAGSAMGQQQTVHAFNAAPHARTEWVLFGTPERTAWTYSQRAGGCLNVGRVTVPAGHDGQVPVQLDDTDEPFRLHEAIAAELAHGFLPFVTVNGNRCDLEPVEWPVVHPRLLVGLWRGRTADAVCELVTYAFHRQPTVRFELSVFCESLSTSSKQLTLGLSFQTGPRVLAWVYDLDATFAGAGAQPKDLGTWTMGDAQGARWDGALMFWTDSMVTNPNGPEVQTALAQTVHPLYAVVQWPTWGPWGKSTNPATLPPPASRRDKPGPFTHLGYICNKRPRDTGEQGEFGAWHHVSTVSSGSSRRLWEEHRAASREVCRPIHYREPDGSLVESARHPSWVTWDEMTHYHPVVSPDRLGRTHGGSSEVPSGGWSGHDRQHQGWQFLSEDVLLTGSYANERIIREQIQVQLAGETLPSMKPGWSTNSADSARGWGRTWIMAEHWRRALPVRDPDAVVLVERMWQRFRQVVEPAWKSRWSRFGSPPIKPFELTQNPNGGTIVGWAWNVWQDGIAAAGADALRLSLLAHGRTQDAALVQVMAADMARGVCLYGYFPDASKLAAYILTPDCQPPSSYTDVAVVIDDRGTDFARWALLAVGVAQRLDVVPQTRIDDILHWHLGRARDTYTGTLQ